MAFVETANTALAELIYIWRDQTVQNTLWFNKTLPYNLATLEDLGDALYNWFLAELSPNLSGDVALVGVKCTAQDSSTAPSWETSFATPIEGGSAGGSVTNNTTWAVQFSTGQRGRSYRGRNYVPGIPTSSVSGNVVGDSWAAAVVAAYGELSALEAAGHGAHVVVSRYSNGAPRSSGLVTEVVSYRYVDLFLDSQRRRLPGRGS